MGQMDQKNFVLEVLIKENLTDPRCVDFMNGWNFTKKDKYAFIASISSTLYNPIAEKIVRFFI